MADNFLMTILDPKRGNVVFNVFQVVDLEPYGDGEYCQLTLSNNRQVVLSQPLETVNGWITDHFRKIQSL